jgi:K+-sensing histidine kinase KdpD
VAEANRDAQRVMERLRWLGELVRDGKREQAAAAVSSEVDKRMMDDCRGAARRIREEEQRMLAKRRASAIRMAVFALLGALLLMAAAVGLLAFAWRRERAHDELLKRMTAEPRQRLAWMLDVASALSEARTPAQVAEVVVAQGMRAAGADTCTLYALDASGSLLELIGEQGVDPAIIEKLRCISESEGNPEMFARLRESKSVWAESEADEHKVFPAVAAMKADGPRAKAFWSVPLYVEGRAIGLLGMGFYAERKFSTDDRAFVEAFVQQCAQALMRVARLEREDESNRWFATTLRSIGDAVIATDAEGLIVFVNPTAEVTRVDEALAAAIKSVTPAATAKPITISSEIASDADLSIVADPNRLQQIVWNLLSNAVKFTPRAGRVFARTKREGSHVCIHVSDAGDPRHGERSVARARRQDPPRLIGRRSTDQTLRNQARSDRE